MTKPEANKMLRKIYRRLKEIRPDISVNSKLGKVFGQITIGINVGESGWDLAHLIEINPNKCGKSFFRTIIHECLHLAEWNAPEKQILKWESEMFEQLSDRQLSNLMKRLYGN